MTPEPVLPKFEVLFARLEEIVHAMEQPDLPLEQLLTQYEEGIGLVKACGERLADAEQRIEVLSRGPMKEENSAVADLTTPEKPEIKLF